MSNTNKKELDVNVILEQLNLNYKAEICSDCQQLYMIPTYKEYVGHTCPDCKVIPFHTLRKGGEQRVKQERIHSL